MVEEVFDKVDDMLICEHAFGWAWKHDGV